MRWQREGGCKDAEVFKGKLPEVCDDGVSSRQIIQVKESCRCASCGGTSETKLLLVLNKRKLPVLGEIKPWCFTRGFFKSHSGLGDFSPHNAVTFSNLTKFSKLCLVLS